MWENKISIVVPVYNKQKQIKRCLNLSINQTYKNLEIIVIDDESIDKSYEKIKNILNLSIIHEAYKEITFDWFLNSEKYKVIKDKDIEKLLVLRSKMVKRNKIKKYFMKLLNLI